MIKFKSAARSGGIPARSRDSVGFPLVAVPRTPTSVSHPDDWES
ncbi:MAG: hypothetical protein O3A82_02510 [Verrucomicrobia bacterium]|nr:hypothetical protein [Verrucomicrobiota bacterium]